MVAQANDRGSSGMEDLIPIVNKLQDVFTQIGPDVQFGELNGSKVYVP